MMGRGDSMKRVMRKLFVVVSVFLLFVHNVHNIKPVRSQEETDLVVDIVIDEGQEGSDFQFDRIDRFSQYGLALVQKDEKKQVFNEVENRFVEETLHKYGIINTRGELVVEIIYDSIEHYDDDYYLAVIENGHLKHGLISKRNGEFVIVPVYNQFPDNMYEKDYFKLDENKIINGERNMLHSLFSSKNNKIEKVKLPHNYHEKDIDYLNIQEISQNLYLIYAIIFVDEESCDSELFAWILDDSFNLLYEFEAKDTDFTAIYQDEILYVLDTKKVNEESIKQLLKGTVENRIYDYEIIVENKGIYFKDALERIGFFYSTIDTETINYIYDIQNHKIEVIEEENTKDIFSLIEELRLKYRNVLYISEWDYIILTEVVTQETDYGYTYEKDFVRLVDSNMDFVIPGTYFSIGYNRATKLFNFLRDYDIEGDEDFWDVADALQGFYNPEEKVYVEPQFLNVHLDMFETYGFAFVEQIQSFRGFLPCEDEEEDENVGAGCSFIPGYHSKSGIINPKGQYILPLDYEKIIGFNSQGYAALLKDIVYENDAYGFPYASDEIISKKIGLYSLHDGLVVDAYYDELLPANSTWFNAYPPLFDKDNHIKTKRIVADGLESVAKYGLINPDGLVFEAEFDDIYFRDGIYYLRNSEQSWTLKVVEENGYDTISLDLSSIEDPIAAIEVFNQEYLILKTIKHGELDSYEDYALYTLNLEKILDFGHTDIRFDGSKWYLERYNEAFNSYEYSILNKDLDVIVPFENKYDSLGEYVGGYAIGQGGEKPKDEGGTGGPFAFMNFFTRVSANEEKGFVIDILNDQGEVVGDLSEKYDKVTLLGMDGDKVKALVEVDGKFFIATLVETQVPVQPSDPKDPTIPKEEIIKIDSVTILQKEVTLTVGQTAQLNGVISPAKHNETIKEYWSTDDETIVVVDGKGLIKAIGAGRTKVNYHVNDWKASVDVIVNPIYAPSKPLEGAERSALENLLKALDEEIELNDAQWLTLLKDVVEIDDLALNFNHAQAIQLEAVYQRVFKDNLVVSIEDSQSMLDEMVGFILAADLKSLLAGKQVEIKVLVNEKLKKEDADLIDAYIENHQLDDAMFYRFDVTVVQIIDGQEVPLNIVRPIVMSQEIPYHLQHRGVLKALTIHNGSLSELPLETSEGRFILSADRFSAFAIFSSAVAEEGEDPVVGVVGTRIPDFVWWLGGLIILVLAFGVFMAFKKKAS